VPRFRRLANAVVGRISSRTRPLFRIGEKEPGNERLNEAITAYREALKEYSRERAPLDWARTKMNLGAALEALGAREDGTVRLIDAIAAYREALQENTKVRAPALWAMTQLSLGNALLECSVQGRS
jgi:tetratricopeptide (TPR) repeat protein